MEEQNNQPKPQGLSNEEVQLLLSFAPRVLCEGNDLVDFARRLKKLRDENQILFERLYGICLRLRFIEQIRESRILVLQSQDMDRAQTQAEYQIGRLSTYLTATCIDVAAGKDKTYKEFHEYLLGEIKGLSRSPDHNGLVATLTQSTSEATTLTKLKGWIDTLLENYFREYGVRRAFSRVIFDLPAWMRGWLADIYFIRDGDLTMFESYRIQQWRATTVDERCARIAKYLFDIRNRYTHTVDYAPPMERIDDFRLAFPTVSGVQYRFNKFHEDGDFEKPVKLTVGLAGELNFVESDVIRLVVLVHLRKWLGLVDDQSFIERCISRWTYRRTCFNLLRELEDNLQIINAWGSIRLHTFPYGHLDLPLRRLTADAAGELASHWRDRFPADDPRFRSYLSTLEIVNAKIDDFNAIYADKHAIEEARESYAFFDSLLNDNEIWRITQLGYEVQMDLSTKLDSNS